MNWTIIDSVTNRADKIKEVMLTQFSVNANHIRFLSDGIVPDEETIYLIHHSDGLVGEFAIKANALNSFVVFYSGGGITNQLKAQGDKIGFISEVFQNGDEPQPLNKIEQIVEIIKNESSNTNAIVEIKKVLGFDEAIENPLKKLATSLPFDYVYNNDADLRNAKSELDKAVAQRLNK